MQEPQSLFNHPFSIKVKNLSVSGLVDSSHGWDGYSFETQIVFKNVKVNGVAKNHICDEYPLIARAIAEKIDAVFLG
jgi:hypothetical protein